MTAFPIPGEFVAVDANGVLRPLVDFWSPTLALRWSKAGELQQLWQDTSGNSQWRPVPREE